MRTSLVSMLSVVTLTTLAVAGCAPSDEDSADQIKVWSHAGGSTEEIAVVQGIVDDYNASQDEVTVVLESFPQSSYNDAVVAAAASGDLPCVVDMDGPIVPNWAWADYIQPLDLPAELTDSLLPSTVGRYQDEIYAVGAFDAALTINARRSALVDNGIRIPTLDEPWTLEEFDAALVTLSADERFEYPIDLGVWDANEWWSYAYSPMLQSFGGDLVDRDTYLSADGVLNGPGGLAFAEWFQSVFERGLASKTPTADGQDFPQGNVAMVYGGSWKALESADTFGDDAIILPVPDFGEGPVIGGGSWQLGVSTTCANPEAANDYLEFSLQDEYIVEFADAVGVIPATDTAAQQAEYFKEGGLLAELPEISRQLARVRPETPGYAVISTSFGKAMQDLVAGADPQATLDQAVKDIDANIKSNDGYGF